VVNYEGGVFWVGVLGVFGVRLGVWGYVCVEVCEVFWADEVVDMYAGGQCPHDCVG
jgi:hypothetical protein